MKSIKEIAVIAATWWADKVTSPKFDNGDNSIEGFFAKSYAAKAVQPVDQVQRDKLIEHLVHSITTRLDIQSTEVLLPGQEPIPPMDMVLGVDYGPDRELLGAALYSGIPSMNFPIKTVMWISKNHVAVKYGYSAGIEVLYANSVYYKKMLVNTEKAIIQYRKDDALFWIPDAKERNQKVDELLTALNNDLIKYQINLKDAQDLESKSKRSKAMTASFQRIYGAARQCGKVDFTTEAFKALERDPSCPPERPMEDILHEVMCSECGGFDAACELTDGGEWLCGVCAEAHKAYYGDPQVCTDLDEENLTEEQSARIDAFFNVHNNPSLTEAFKALERDPSPACREESSGRKIIKILLDPRCAQCSCPQCVDFPCTIAQMAQIGTSGDLLCSYCSSVVVVQSVEENIKYYVEQSRLGAIRCFKPKVPMSKEEL